MHEKPENTIALQDYVDVVWRRKWIILVVLVVIPLATVFFARREAAVYEASSKVLLSRQNLANALTGVADPNSSISEATLTNTQAQVARAPEIERRVLERLGFADAPVGFLYGQSSVTTAPDSQILTFTVSSTDPAFAVEAATEYGREYTRYRRRIDTAPLASARKGLNERLDEMRRGGQDEGPLYDALVTREGTLSAMEALETSNAQLVEPATAAAKISPDPGRDGAIALVVALVLGLGLAFLREAFDTRLRKSAEIADQLDLPLLARIPEPDQQLDAGDELVTAGEPAGRDAEAFRILRTNLEFAMLDRDVGSLLVTSALEGEGKSTTIANLGIAFARAGRRVILVDLDLRLPRQARFFDLEDQPGITDVLLGNATLAEALAKVPILPPDFGLEPGSEGHPDSPTPLSANGSGGTLEVLASGPLPPDPGEVVSSNRLGALLGELRAKADLVLIDSPPLIHVGDAIALSARVDALAVVVKLQAARRGVLSEAARVLGRARAERLGFILTGAEAEDAYGYGSGRRYFAHRHDRERERVT